MLIFKGAQLLHERRIVAFECWYFTVKLLNLELKLLVPSSQARKLIAVLILGVKYRLLEGDKLLLERVLDLGRNG